MASNSKIDDYLTELHRHLSSWHRHPDDVVAEAADHLHERVEILIVDGMAADDATALAIEEHGSARETAEAHLRATRRPAIPTTDTRMAGIFAIVGGLAWVVLPLLTVFVPSEAVIVFLGLASVFHAAIVMTVLACIGLWLRHGGLGPLAIAAAVPAVLAAPFVLFSWPIPAWMTLLGVATLLFGLAIIRRRIVPLRSAIGLTFGMALSGAAVISAEILVSPTDDDFAFAQSTPAILTMIVGLIVFGLGLADTGRWLRSEQPVRIPPLPAPTRARPATS